TGELHGEAPGLLGTVREVGWVDDLHRDRSSTKRQGQRQCHSPKHGRSTGPEARVKPQTSWPEPPASPRSDCQHRTPRDGDDPLGDTPQEYPAESRAAVGPDDDEVRPCGSGRAHDTIVGVSLQEQAFRTDPTPPGLRYEPGEPTFRARSDLGEPPVIDLAGGV